VVILRILLTGATGFVGSNLRQKLIEKSYETYSLVRHVAGRYEYLKSEGEKYVFGDLTDFTRVKEVVREIDPQVVIHLAAKTPVSLSFNEPMDFWEIIATSTINLAEACRELKNLEKFIHASTSEVYGVQTEFPIKETAPFHPVSPYACAKVAAEYYLRMLYEVYGFPIIIARPFNTYGRTTSKHYVTERAITTLLETGEIKLWNPYSIRDFLYVEDHVSGYLTLLEKGKVGEAYNICTGKGYSIKELTDKIIEIVGYGKANFSLQKDRAFEIPCLIGDNSKLKSLGWTVRYDLESGLKETIKKWKVILRGGKFE
jgi:dTDP-glucose 4,6-dehydratase